MKRLFTPTFHIKDWMECASETMKVPIEYIPGSVSAKCCQIQLENMFNNETISHDATIQKSISTLKDIVKDKIITRIDMFAAVVEERLTHYGPMITYMLFLTLHEQYQPIKKRRIKKPQPIIQLMKRRGMF